MDGSKSLIALSNGRSTKTANNILTSHPERNLRQLLGSSNEYPNDRRNLPNLASARPAVASVFPTATFSCPSIPLRPLPRFHIIIAPSSLQSKPDVLRTHRSWRFTERIELSLIIDKPGRNISDVHPLCLSYPLYRHASIIRRVPYFRRRSTSHLRSLHSPHSHILATHIALAQSLPFP